MYVVLFHIRTRPEVDEDAYGQAFEEMLATVAAVPGFISIEGFTGEDGSEMAVVRFESEEAIVAWRNHPDHVRTRDRGREEFFDSYEIAVAEVTRAYAWRRGDPPPVFPATSSGGQAASRQAAGPAAR
jgi:heme-degrading monooxygenase HmoA